MWLKLTKNYSPNFDPKKRLKKRIRHIIIHYTGMKSELLAVKRLCDYKSKVSAHYFIKKNGDLLNLVPDLYVSWHAGKSNWGDYKRLNKSSIGIEIHNNGSEEFTKNQLNTLKKLLKTLIIKYRIDLKNVLGHSDIAPDRKEDPGKKFPWKNLSKSKLAYFHNLKDKNIKKLRLLKLSKGEEKYFLKYLNEFGYRTVKSLTKTGKKNIIKAFQRRFRQKLINGIPDKECLTISKNLLKI